MFLWDFSELYQITRSHSQKTIFVTSGSVKKCFQSCISRTGICDECGRHNTTRQDTIRRHTTQHEIARHGMWQYNTTRHDTTRHDTTRHNATDTLQNSIQLHTTYHDTIRRDTTRHGMTLQRNTAQHDTIYDKTTHVRPSTTQHNQPNTIGHDTQHNASELDPTLPDREQQNAYLDTGATTASDFSQNGLQRVSHHSRGVNVEGWWGRINLCMYSELYRVVTPPSFLCGSQSLTAEDTDRNTAWLKKMDSKSYVYISWTIHGMWMIVHNIWKRRS
jgi:hypothetical protein